jgi:ketosteroid isomerase-like protein
MKSDLEVFLHYAAAFETAYATDKWQPVRECFADDAVYEVEGSPPFAGTWKGGDEIVRHLIESVNSFDRTYDERALEVLEGPEMRDGAVFIRWGGVYKKKGQDDLRIKGTEYAWIKDGKIQRLKDGM